MNYFKIYHKLELTKFLLHLNDANKSSFRFTIKDEKYIDVLLDEMENCDT